MIPGIFPGGIRSSARARHRAATNRNARQRGFSLYELLVTLGIAGMLSLGATSAYGIVRDQRLTTEVNLLVGHLALARSEAIVRRQHVVLCPTSDYRECDKATDFTWWHRGLMLFVDHNGNGRVDADEQPLRIHSPAAANVRIKSSRFRPRVVYQPTGLASGAGATVTFTFCDERGTARPRYVIISNTGRPRVSALPPDGKIDSGLERCT